MKRILKVLSVILMVSLMFGVILAGCNKTQTQDTTTAPAGTTAATTAAQTTAKVEPKTVKFYSWETSLTEENERVIKAFNEEYPHITIQMEYLGDMNNAEYLKKIDLMLLSNEDLDIVMFPAFGEHALRAVSGTLEPLDDYFAKEGVDYSNVYTFRSPVNGKIYGLPGDVKSYLVLINKKHLDEAGLPLPPLDWTWADYREYAKKLTKGEGKDKRYGSYFHTWDNYNYLAFYTDKLDNPFWKDENTLNFDDPLFKEFMQFRWEMENVDKSQVPFIDCKSLNLNYRTQFFNEKVSMLPTGSWLLKEIRDTEKFPHDFVTAFAPLPRWSKDTPAGRTNTEAMYYSITKSSKVKEEAYNYLRFYTTKGMIIKASSLTAEKGGDKIKLIEGIIGANPEKLFDTDSLFKVFTNPNWVDNPYTIIPTYHQEMRTVFTEESEKFLVGGASIDEVMENIKRRCQEIYEKNKK